MQLTLQEEMVLQTLEALLLLVVLAETVALATSIEQTEMWVEEARQVRLALVGT
jgi:hypothetical protein